MTTPLPPAAALAWLGSLTVDLHAAAVVGADGAVVAGDPELARRAAAALATAPGVRELREGSLLVVRDAHRAIAVDVGPRALAGLTLADLRAALAELAAP